MLQPVNEGLLSKKRTHHVQVDLFDNRWDLYWLLSFVAHFSVTEYGVFKNFVDKPGGGGFIKCISLIRQNAPLGGGYAEKI